jgi:hypothetical protein
VPATAGAVNSAAHSNRLQSRIGLGSFTPGAGHDGRDVTL